MSLTTIPIQKSTRDKLKEFASKSESWDDLLNRLYQNAAEVNTAQVFFSPDSLSVEEAIEEIERWK